MLRADHFLRGCRKGAPMFKQILVPVDLADPELAKPSIEKTSKS